MDPFTISTGVVGFLSLAIEITKALEGYISGVKSAPDDAQLLLTEITSLCQVLKQLVDFLRSENVKGKAFDRTSVLCSVVALCQNQIEGLYKRMDKFRGSDKTSRVIQRMKWPIDEKECRRVIETLQRCSQIFHFSLNVSNCALLSETSDSVLSALESQQKQLKQTLAVVPQLRDEISRTLVQISEVREIIATLADSGRLIQSIFLNIQELQLRSKDKLTDRLLRWLSPLEPQKRHQEIRSRRLNDTGWWLLQKNEFQIWRDGNSNDFQHVIWCPGIPGAGKTVISSLVIDHLAAESVEQAIGISFLYCDYRDRGDQTAVNMLGGLLKQLVLALPNIPQDVIQLFEKNQRECIMLELAEAEKLLFSISRTFDRVYICIDAVDECSSGQRKDFLRALKRSLHPSIRLFITGRTNIQGDIDRCLCPQLTIPIVANKNDVRKYVVFKLDEDSDPELMDENLKGEIVRAIEAAHDGMFLLPALQIQTVLDQRRKSERRAVLKRLPTGLHEAYTATMVRIQAQPRSWSAEALTILMWIFMAERPLKLDELCHALSVKVGETELDPDNVPPRESLLDCCLGLIILDKETLTVRLVHLSLQEYLLTHQLTLFKTAHAQIASTCLTYLHLEDRSNARTDIEVDERLEKFPFLNYAVCQWGHHARKETDEVVEALALDLLLSQPRFSRVVDVLYQHLRSLFLVGVDAMQCPAKFSAMHVAAYFGAPRVVQALLESQDVGSMDQDNRTPLHWAARQGHEATVRVLLENGADVRAKDGGGWAALHWAAWKGHEPTVRLLLEKGAGINDKDDHAWTALHWAAVQGREATVQVLLEKGADVKERDGGGWMPLHRAAKHGHEATVRVLLDHGANIMARFIGGWTALDEASQEGHDATVRLLLEKGSDIRTADDCGRTPLHWAAQEGHNTTVQLLMERGAEVEAKSVEGWTALHWAVQEGHEASVNVLLKNGANVDETDGSGWTALHWASMQAHAPTVRMLLEKDADVKAKSEDGWTALDLACLQGNVEILLALLENGAEVDANGDDGWTALHWAALQGHDVAVRVLLEKGADIRAKDSSGATAMSWAAMQGHDTTMQLLCKQGADITEKDRDTIAADLANRQGQGLRVRIVLDKGANVRTKEGGGYTTLHIAADEGHDASVRMLLEKGANINARDGKGMTALHYASMGGHDAAAHALLEQGPNIDARDCNGMTALHWASMNGHDAVVRMLLEKSADISGSDDYGWTALSSAAREGRDVVVKLLLENDSIDQNWQDDKYSQIPLLWATLNGHEAVVRLLLEKGADPNLKDVNKGETLLSRAVENGSEKLVRLFLEMGTDSDLRDDDGRTPLSRAVVNGNETLVGLLLEKGLDPNTQVDDGQTVLHLASERGHEAVAELLLRKGATVTATWDNGLTALHQAAAGGHDAIVRLLVRNGADVGARGKMGWTALHDAAASGHEGVAQSLVEMGADIAASDERGATGLHWAASCGHEAALQLLLMKGADATAETNQGWTALDCADFNNHEAVVRLLEPLTPNSHLLVKSDSID